MSHGRRLTRKQKRRHGEADGEEFECPGCRKRFWLSSFAKLSAALMGIQPVCSRECNTNVNGGRR